MQGIDEVTESGLQVIQTQEELQKVENTEGIEAGIGLGVTEGILEVENLQIHVGTVLSDLTVNQGIVDSHNVP